MRARAAVALAVALVGVAGCGGGSEHFSGDEQQVVVVVRELEQAGRAHDARRICEDILSARLVRALRKAGVSCVREMVRSLRSAKDFDLHVRDVAVHGDRARARVSAPGRSGSDVLNFVREGGYWRLAAFAGR